MALVCSVVFLQHPLAMQVGRCGASLALSGRVCTAALVGWGGLKGGESMFELWPPSLATRGLACLLPCGRQSRHPPAPASSCQWGRRPGSLSPGAHLSRATHRTVV